jgi:hypothetical protein
VWHAYTVPTSTHAHQPNTRDALCCLGGGMDTAHLKVCMATNPITKSTVGVHTRIVQKSASFCHTCTCMRVEKGGSHKQAANVKTVMHARKPTRTCNSGVNTQLADCPQDHANTLWQPVRTSVVAAVLPASRTTSNTSNQNDHPLTTARGPR